MPILKKDKKDYTPHIYQTSTFFQKHMNKETVYTFFRWLNKFSRLCTALIWTRPSAILTGSIAFSFTAHTRVPGMISIQKQITACEHFMVPIHMNETFLA